MSAKRDEALHYLELCRAAIMELDEVETSSAPIVVPEAAKAPVGLQKPAAFYDFIRGDAGELFPTMSESQFAGVEMDLHLGAGVLPRSWMAYCLATDYHETGKRMVGVKEGFDVSDAWRKSHLRYYPWYGRGKVQLTWERNYVFATKRLKELGYDVDLVANPDLALDLKVAAVVLTVGMLEGWFTGKKLRDFIPANATRTHYRNARQIVNGLDRADLIAGYAIVFDQALQKGEWL